MIKPGGVQRGLAGEIITRFERKGLKIVAMKMLQLSTELAERHYSEHKEKSFFPALIKFITSGPVIAFVLEGPSAVNIVRKLVGATNPDDSEAGTIRGDFVINTTYNIIHASDSLESSEREIGGFFRSDEIIDYDLKLKPYLFPG